MRLTRTQAISTSVLDGHLKALIQLIKMDISWKLSYAAAPSVPVTDLSASLPKAYNFA